MNINDQTKKVLVYGDSLPWGLVPGSTTFERLPANIRWPGKLQGLLGDNYEIIEECLCARTLDSDDLRPGFEGRNGQSHLITCIDSHDPIDTIILSLGLNEIKSIYPWTAQQVAEKMKYMVETIKNRKPNFHDVKIRIILLTQPEVRENTGYWGELWVGSNIKSVELADEYRKLANETNVELCDVNKYIKTGIDGVHLDEVAHNRVAEELVSFFS